MSEAVWIKLIETLPLLLAAAPAVLAAVKAAQAAREAAGNRVAVDGLTARTDVLHREVNGTTAKAVAAAKAVSDERIADLERRVQSAGDLAVQVQRLAALVEGHTNDLLDERLAATHGDGVQAGPAPTPTPTPTPSP